MFVVLGQEAKSVASAPSAVGLGTSLGGPALGGFLSAGSSSGEQTTLPLCDGAAKGKGKICKRGAEKQFWCRLCESYTEDPGKKKYCLRCNRAWECALTRAKASKQLPMLQDISKDLPLLRRFLQAQEEALGPSLGQGWRRGGWGVCDRCKALTLPSSWRTLGKEVQSKLSLQSRKRR
eukprot:6466732-Amphidinium_carterae.1